MVSGGVWEQAPVVTTVGMIGGVDSSMADSDAFQDTVGTNNPSLGLVQFPAK